ncbi:MAG: diaminopimelate decarboxylase [Planctomycetaceae bacterium]|nr:diaminopimelate decarboxylase [Planctomycetaceae bacterium]
MTEKTIPVSAEKLEEIAAEYPTPFYLYDEAGIRETARTLNSAFDWCPNFQEYFAVKATPNPHIVRILQEEGCGADCSSLAELVICERLGMSGTDIMFTSNNTQWQEYKHACDMGAIVNIDDVTHIDYLAANVGLPDLICARFNPGPARGGNAIIGKPEDAKYGFTHDQMINGYRELQNRGVHRFGIHTMVASNELDLKFFVETARMLCTLGLEIKRELGISIEFMNLGGGIGIPYRPEQDSVDLAELGREIHKIYESLDVGNQLDHPAVLMENGRVMTGPHGYLVTRAIHRKSIYKNYVGVDACMANLMRPGMYGAYHHVTVVGKDPHTHPTECCDVVGSLCENNDKFAIDREIPSVEMGDLIVIHDAGAHGHAMGFQYNGKLRSAELLLRADGSVELIRRAETLDDYFATIVGSPDPVSAKP